LPDRADAVGIRTMPPPRPFPCFEGRGGKKLYSVSSTFRICTVFGSSISSSGSRSRWMRLVRILGRAVGHRFQAVPIGDGHELGLVLAILAHHLDSTAPFFFSGSIPFSSQ